MGGSRWSACGAHLCCSTRLAAVQAAGERLSRMMPVPAQATPGSAGAGWVAAWPCRFRVSGSGPDSSLIQGASAGHARPGQPGASGRQPAVSRYDPGRCHRPDPTGTLALAQRALPVPETPASLTLVCRPSVSQVTFGLPGVPARPQVPARLLRLPVAPVLAQPPPRGQMLAAIPAAARRRWLQGAGRRCDLDKLRCALSLLGGHPQCRGALERCRGGMQRAQRGAPPALRVVVEAVRALEGGQAGLQALQRMAVRACAACIPVVTTAACISGSIL